MYYRKVIFFNNFDKEGTDNLLCERKVLLEISSIDFYFSNSTNSKILFYYVYLRCI